MNVSFHVIDTADYLKPIGVLLRFNLSDSESSPVLDDRCPSSVRRMVPFFKDCGEDDECITDLSLKARMDIVGTRDKPHIIRRTAGRWRWRRSWRTAEKTPTTPA
ncbi:unnamed protein product [Staurois parvus]|uniref:Uncharacterized protein n=1 Tax=Staurois parvus TaxID=386267 RepID=A0ABN9G9D1_9NEOB|nr:unnamed protein product [Staurois parvus]